MSNKEEHGAKISHEGTISREAFVRAWSFGTLEEQGRMLFDLLGESVIARIRNIEEQQRNNTLRLDILEEKRADLQIEIQKSFTDLERKWAYIAGGIAVLAVLASPFIMAIAGFFKNTGSCP